MKRQSGLGEHRDVQRELTVVEARIVPPRKQKVGIRQKMSTFNYLNVPKKVSDMPSMTRPDQSMTIVEIMARYQRGMPMGSLRIHEGVFEGDDDTVVANWDTLDISEKYAIMESRAAELKDLKQKIQDQRKKDAEKKAERLRKLREDQNDDQHFLDDDQGTEDAKPPKGFKTSPPPKGPDLRNEDRGSAPSRRRGN